MPLERTTFLEVHGHEEIPSEPDEDPASRGAYMTVHGCATDTCESSLREETCEHDPSFQVLDPETKFLEQFLDDEITQAVQEARNSVLTSLDDHGSVPRSVDPNSSDDSSAYNGIEFVGSWQIYCKGI